MKKSHLFVFLALISFAAPAVAETAQDHAKAAQSIQKKVRILETQLKPFSEIPKIMEELEPLMKQSKFTEAEAVVDRALQLIKELKAVPME